MAAGVNQPGIAGKAKPDDDVTLILPSIGAQISDKDNLRIRLMTSAMT
jgi:hypothetical protein